MWQEVEELERLKVNCIVCFHNSTIIETVGLSFNVGNPTLGITVEVRSHVREDDVWQLRLRFSIPVCNAPKVIFSGRVRGNSLGPLRCLSQDRRVGFLPLEDCCSSEGQTEGVCVWEK